MQWLFCHFPYIFVSQVAFISIIILICKHKRLFTKKFQLISLKSIQTLNSLLTRVGAISSISSVGRICNTKLIVSSAVGMGNSQSSRAKSSQSPSDFINNTVKNDPVVVFSKTTCPHCVTVKSLFNQLNVPATVIELDKRQDGKELHPALIELTGARTVPQVFVCGQRVGGASDTVALHKAGGLEQLIAKCWKPARCEGPKCDIKS